MIARIAVFGLAIAEALAVYTAMEWIAATYSGPDAGAVSVFSFVGLSLCAFSLPKALEGWDLSRRTSLIVGGLAAYVAIFGVLHIEFAGNANIWDFSWAADFVRDPSAATATGGHAVIAALVLGGLWVRSSMRGSDDIDLEFIPRGIAVPFAAVTVITILAAPTGRAGEVARGAAAFYAVGVVVLACSQMALSGATFGTMRAGGVTAALMAGTLIVTLAGIAIFGLAFTVFREPIGWFLGTIVEGVLTVILVPWAWALEHLFKLIFGGRDPLGGFSEAARQGAQDAKKGDNTHSPSAWAQLVTYALRILALLVVAAMVAGLSALYLRIRRRGLVTEVAGEAAAAGSFGDDLRNFFGSMFRRGSGRAYPVTNSRTVELYRDVLRRAEDRGRARQAAVTAGEFSPELAEEFRGGITDEITRAFEEARYAGRELDAAAVSDLERRWKLVRQG